MEIEHNDLKERRNQRLKQRVQRDIAGRRREIQERQKQLFIRTYDKLRDYEFPPAEEINMNKYFNFVKFNNGFCMSKNAMQIYPVLCSRADFEKDQWFQLSRANIAKMAGVSLNTVSKGLQDLLECSIDKKPFLQMQKQTEGKRHFYVYQVGMLRKDAIREWRGNYFIFHTCIIDSGVWAALKPRAKFLYLAMRMKAVFDADLYSSIELEDLNLEDLENSSAFFHGETFRNRRWDVCVTPLSALCRLVQISSVNISNSVRELEKYRLVERVHEQFKVYLRPKIRKRRTCP